MVPWLCVSLTPTLSLRERERWPVALAVPGADVDEVAGQGGGGGHLGPDEVGAASFALASLEVAIGGGGAALAGLQDVRVHAQAHGAACLAPVKAGGPEDLVQALGLGRCLYLHRARHHHGVDVRVDLLALHHGGGG